MRSRTRSRASLPGAPAFRTCIAAVLACGIGGPLVAFTVAIHEVHYHPADDLAGLEFIEIHNYGAEDESLDGWILAGGVSFRFPSGSVLPAGGFGLVAADGEALLRRYELDPAILLGEFQGRLENNGEAIALVAFDSLLVSSVHFGDSDPWPEAPDGLGPSLERRSPLLDDSDPQAWGASLFLGGTPGAPNSIAADVTGSVQDGERTMPVIPPGSIWRFFRGTQQPPPQWNALEFDDSGWESGPAGFGYDRGDFTTVLDDMRNRYTTVFLRHGFQLEDPSRLTGLRLTVNYDDAFVAYLNGIEVGRVNLAGGAGSPVPHDATAPVTTRLPETVEIDLAAFLDELRPGDNVLAVQGVNGALDSRDFTIHPSLAAVFSTSGTRTMTFVPAGADWSFFRGANPPPAEWTELAFDDAAWEVGPAGFGYGDGDDATPLDDMPGAYLTVFIRHRFEAGAAELSDLIEVFLDVDYDDGFVAYLNGTEVARSGVGSTAHDAVATASHEAGGPERFFLPPGLLREGTNLLALQGHNTNLGSSDFSLSPALGGRIQEEVPPDDDPPPPRVPPARDLVINEIAAGGQGTGWVELYHPGSGDLEVGGRELVLETPDLARYVFPAAAQVAPRGFARLTEAELGFELDGIASLVLLAPDGRIIDALNPRATPPGHSAGRFPDGADNRFVFPQPTPGGANRIDLESPVAIHEVHYHPADDDAGGEFIELFNRSAAAVDLSGWAFTRGISYVFPEGTSVPPGGYVLIAQDPSALEAARGLAGVLGPWEGRLRNDAETILLRDALGNPRDRVRYADEGSWPEAADGGGPSLELIHPEVENRFGPAWRASADSGTPGAPNSAFEADPDPVIGGVSHEPVVPSPAAAVRVIATVSDTEPIAAVVLRYAQDGIGTPPASALMLDDGLSDDGIAANGVFGAEIPPYPLRSIIAFWIEATSTDGGATTVPSGAPSPAFLYQVESTGADEAIPVYRIVMRAADLNRLRTRGNGSDVLLDCTFVAGDRAYYTRGIRYRGSSARSCNPLSYRVQFDHDVDLQGFQRLNLNGCNVERQWIGLDFLRRTGIPTPLAWFRRLSINGQLESDLYLRVETIDEEFLDRALPGDSGGNLYRGSNQANLDYRGGDFSRYQAHYEKRSNEELGDYSDIVDLSRRFDRTLTPDADFPAAIEERVDVDEWALFFAAFAILGSTENSILLDNGDDYFLYHRPSDGRWILLPWDLDSVFNEADQRLFRPTVDAIQRFLRHPRYAASYWCSLDALLDGPFLEEFIASRLDRLSSVLPATQVNRLRAYPPARRTYVDSRIVRSLAMTLSSPGTLCEGVVVTAQTDPSFRGLAPGCGTSEVRLNGTPVAYDAVTNAWTGQVDLDAARWAVVSTHDRLGFETSRVEMPVVQPQTPPDVPAAISADLTLTSDASPYLLGDTLVERGATLHVARGAALLFGPGASLRVEGRLVIGGTSAAPVLLQALDCSNRWAGIHIRSGSAGAEIRHAELRFTGAPGAAAAVLVEASDAVLEGVLVDAAAAVGVLARGGSTLELVGCELRGGPGGLVLEDASAAVRSCRFSGHAAEAIAASGSSTFRIDVAASIIEDSATALVLSGGLEAELEHLTLHGCPRGLVLTSAGSPPAGPRVTAHSLIVWQSPEAVVLDPASSLDLSYSDTDGGAQPGKGNISADPLFVDPASGEFRLEPASPCRGTGRDGSDMGAVPSDGPAEGNRYLLCDTNGDGANNLTDAVFLLLHLFARGPGPACERSADCNGDGAANLTDAIFDLTHLFQGGPSPSPPYPACATAPRAECAVETCIE